MVLLAGLQAGLYAAWITPTSAALSAQEARSREVRGQIQALLFYQEQRHRLASLTRQFPSQKLLPKAIGRISSLGRQAGVTIPEMSFQPAKIASPKWAKVDLQFNARGSYRDIRRFLAELEGAAEPFVIESIGLNKDERTGQVVAKLVVGVYARDE